MEELGHLRTAESNGDPFGPYQRDFELYKINAEYHLALELRKFR